MLFSPASCVFFAIALCTLTSSLLLFLGASLCVLVWIICYLFFLTHTLFIAVCFQSATVTYSFVLNFVCTQFRVYARSFSPSCSLSLARSLGFGTKRKSSSGCGVLNKSKRHPVCAYMQMYVIKIIESHTKC